MVEESESSQNAVASSSRLSLYLIDGKATIWDAQTAATLHCSHGISGLRVGTLPGVSQQNAFLGLPITLTPEETAYCVNTGVAQLIPVRSSPIPPTREQVEQTARARIERIQLTEQSQKADKARKAAIARQAFEQGGEGAKAKREARARAKAEKRKNKQVSGDGFDLHTGEEGEPSQHLTSAVPLNELADDENEGNTKASSSKSPINTRKATPLADPAMSSKTLSSKSPKGKLRLSNTHFHTVPSHPLFPDLALSESITHLPHPSFPFPSAPRDKALIDTFTTLHKRGYMIGLGPRFGGEYLVYPGDYLRYHAHFTSQVLVNDECIKPMEVVGWGRLGTGTKKAGLLCCWDDGQSRDRTKVTTKSQAEDDKEEDSVQMASEAGEGNVEFYSLEWANFG